MYVVTVIRFNCTMQLALFFYAETISRVGSCLKFKLIIAYTRKQILFKPSHQQGQLVPLAEKEL